MCMYVCLTCMCDVCIMYAGTLRVAYVQCISGILIMDLLGWYSSRRLETTIKSKGAGTQYTWLKCRYIISPEQYNVSSSYPLLFPGEGPQCPLQADIYCHVVAANNQGGFRDHEPGGKFDTPSRGRSPNWGREPSHIKFGENGRGMFCND